MALKILRVMILVACSAFVVVQPSWCGAALAQSNDLIVPAPAVPEALAGLPRLDAIKSLPTTGAAEVVRLNVGALTRETTRVAIPRGQTLLFSKGHVDLEAADSFTWSGVLTSDQGQASFVVEGGQVTGSIRANGVLYQVEPLGSGLHALITVDESKFPPEHPPSFEAIEREAVEPRAEAAPPEGPAAGPVTIDVLVGYTPAARVAAPNIGAKIKLAVEEANQSYRNSGVNITLRLVDRFELAYSESGKSFSTVLADFRSDAGVQARRDQAGADLAVLIIDKAEFCGLASAIRARAATAFAAVHYSCATGNYSFAHELGHLMGARHDLNNDSGTTPFPYGHGFQHLTPAPRWRTIMAYDCSGGSCPRLQYWSNPDLTYNGYPMGNAVTANDARVLNATAREMAAFRAPVADAPATVADRRDVAGAAEMAEAPAPGREAAADARPHPPLYNPRPALPLPPGVTVQSQCGAANELQDVEFYNGQAGVAKAYVEANEPSTLQLQWLDQTSITSRFPNASPGNVAGQRWCTGTLITDRLVLTAGHCFDVNTGDTGWVTPFEIGADNRPKYLRSEALAPLLVANFRYQKDKASGAIRLPDVYPVTKLVEHRLGGLDYAIVELGPGAGGKLPGETVVHAEITNHSPVANETLAILQHPQGQPKKVGIGHLLETSGVDVFYDDIDTWGGSSGSGVRDADGRIIAVHTNGGCSPDPGVGANRGVDIRAIAAVSSQF